MSLYFQIILATPTTGVSDPLKSVSFALVVFSCGVPLSDLNTSDGILYLLVLQCIQFKFYQVVVHLKRCFPFLLMVIFLDLADKQFFVIARLRPQVERLDHFPRNEHSWKDTEMQGGFDSCILDRFFQKLGIFSVHELFHIFRICLVVRCSSSSGDPSPFSLLAGIYVLVWHSCLHNQHSWILRLSISFGVLKIPTLCTHQWLSEDLIRFLAITFLARCCRISHKRFCRELSSHTTHQIRTCSLSYGTQ